MTRSNVVGSLNCINGTVLCALSASDTLILINVEGKKALTYSRRALLVHNVGNIFIAEELKSCENGVGCSLSETAKRICLNIVAKLLKSVNILESTLALDNLIEKLEKTPDLGLKIYNLGTGNGYSVLQIVKAFEKASKRPVPYKICPRRPGDIAECWADPSLAAAELGWKAERGIEEMCEDAWRWQKKNPYGYNKKV